MLHRDRQAPPDPKTCAHGVVFGWQWSDKCNLWFPDDATCSLCEIERKKTAAIQANRADQKLRQEKLDKDFGYSGFGIDCDNADFTAKDYMHKDHIERMEGLEKWVNLIINGKLDSGKNWLFLAGKPGRGKTFALAAAYLAFRRAGVTVTYHRGSDFWARAKSIAYGKGSTKSLSDAIRDMIGNAQVVLLDDLVHLSRGLSGKDYEILFLLVDELHKQRRPIMWAVNWPLESGRPDLPSVQKFCADNAINQNPVYDRIRSRAKQSTFDGWPSLRGEPVKQEDLFKGDSDGVPQEDRSIFPRCGILQTRARMEQGEKV